MINAETLAAIDAGFEEAVKNNRSIQKLYRRIRDGTATFEDAGEFAKQIGTALSGSFKEHITVDILPDGRLTWNIGNEVVRPEIVKGYNYTASFFNDVQSAFYKKKGLNIRGAPPDLNEDRINGFLNKLDSEEYENVSWVLEDPAYLQNYMESVVDTGIKIAVGLLAQAGIRSKVIRLIDGNACPWCRNMAGEFEYPVNDEIYRRHRDCHCRISYDVGDFRNAGNNGLRWFESDTEAQARQRFSSAQKVFTPEQAAALQDTLMNQ